MVRLNDYGKMLTLIIISVGLIVLLALGAVPEVAGFSALGTIIGYVTGNGVNARRAEAPSPVLSAARHTPPVVLPVDYQRGPSQLAPPAAHAEPEPAPRGPNL